MEGIQQLIMLLTPYALRLNLYTMLFLGGMLLLFILVFVLGILLWRSKAVGVFLVFFACSIPFFAPFCLQLFSQKVLFPLEANLEAKTLSYSPTLFVNGTFTPKSKLPIKACLLTIRIHPPATNLKSKIQAFLKPKRIEYETIKGPFVAGEAVNVQYTFNGMEENLEAKVEVDCY